MEFVEGKEWIEVNLHPLDVYKAIAASRSDLSQMLSNIGTAMMKSKSSAQLNRLELELPKEYDPYCSPQLRSGLWCLHRRNNCPRCALAVDVNNAGDLPNITLSPSDIDHGIDGQAVCCAHSLIEANRLANCGCMESDSIDGVPLETSDDGNLLKEQSQERQKQPVLRDDADLPAVFLILLNLSVNDYYQMLISLQTSMDGTECGSQSIWDPFASTCRPVYCSPMLKTDSQCFPYNESSPLAANDYSFDKNIVQVTLYANIDLNVIVNDSSLIAIRDGFGDSLCEFVGISRDRVTNVTVTLVAGDQQQASNDSTADTNQQIKIQFLLKEDISLQSSLQVQEQTTTTDMIMAYIGSIVVQDQLSTIIGGNFQ